MGNQSKLAVANVGGSASGTPNLVEGIKTGLWGTDWSGYALQGGLTGAMMGSAHVDLVTLDEVDTAMLASVGQAYPRFDRAVEVKGESAFNAVAGTLVRAGITGLILVGGNGSSGLYNALYPFLQQHGIRAGFTAKTLDGDIDQFGLDALGFHTAVTRAQGMLNGLRVNLRSNDANRLFVVQLMGRTCGRLAMCACVGSLCRNFLIPEEVPTRTPAVQVVEWLAASWLKLLHIAKAPWDKGQIFVMAEGLAEKLVPPENSHVYLPGEEPKLGETGLYMYFARSVARLLREEFHVSGRQFSGADGYKYGHESLRDSPADGRDAMTAYTLGFMLAEAIVAGGDDVVAVRHGDTFKVVPRSELLQQLGPFATAVVDPSRDAIYRAAAARRERIAFASHDLGDWPLLHAMAEHTNGAFSAQQLRDRFSDVAWLGDCKTRIAE